MKSEYSVRLSPFFMFLVYGIAARFIPLRFSLISYSVPPYNRGHPLVSSCPPLFPLAPSCSSSCSPLRLRFLRALRQAEVLTPPGFTPRFRAPSVVAPSFPSVFVPLAFVPLPSSPPRSSALFSPLFGPLASPASHCRLCAPRLFRTGYSISRRLRNAWVMVNSSTYSNSSPNPMPRAIEVIFKPG